MTRIALLLAFAPLVAAGAPPSADPALPSPEGLSVVTLATKDRRLAGLRVVEGLAVAVVAEAPVLNDPLAMTFDGDGTPLVLDRVKGRTRVVALSAAKEDGPFDKSRLLLEADAAGLLMHDGWLYLAGPTGVTRHRPSKPGGAYDKQETVVKGLRGAAGLAVGPDGWLYVAARGEVVRCRLDGTGRHTFALGARQPAGPPAFDVAGRAFLTDHAPAGARLVHLAEAVDLASMPALRRLGRGPVGGVTIYNDTRLPAELRGLLLCPDAGAGVVRAYQLQSHRDTFRPTEELELLSSPKRTLAPRQVAVGPDGALYVLSAATGDRQATGRLFRLSWGGTTDHPALALRGRDSWARARRLKDAELIAALARPEASEREQAVFELRRRGDKNRAALLKLLEDDESPAVARLGAVTALGAMYNLDVRAGLLQALGQEFEVAWRAARLLGLEAKKGDKLVQEGLLKALTVEDAAVRRAIALAMGRVAAPGAADGLATALSFDDGKGRYLRDAYLRGLEALGKDGITALLALADSGVQKDTDKVIEAFATLRTPAAFDALPTLLNSPHVSSAQAAQLIRAAARYPLRPAPSFEAIATWAARQKKLAPVVSAALLEVLARPETNKGVKAVAWAAGWLASEEEATRELAARVSLATRDGALAVAERLTDGKLPRRVLPEALAALRSHAATNDAAARALLRLAQALRVNLDPAERALVLEAAWRAQAK